MIDPSEVVRLVKRSTEGPILDPREPLASARVFLNARHNQGGLRTLHHHRGEFFVWTGNAYRTSEDGEIRAELYEFLDGARRMEGSTPKPFQPNRAKIGDVIDALRACAQLPAIVSPPAWLETIPGLRDSPDAYLPVGNGLLHVPTRELHGATPAYFATASLPVKFDPIAYAPTTWFRFLDALWPDDTETIATLQEMFGYVLAPDICHQKIFLLVGPKRSGKGTIARTLTALLGTEATASPTLSALGTNFGLAPLIGKRLATITDARVGGRADQAAIAERLLSISGEDLQTIDRKFLHAWTGRLRVKFLILTNELPRITDASGALVSRFVALVLTTSFYGQEDTSLSHRIEGELSGILNWSLDGLDRLRERGAFLQPSSAREALEELEHLGSPILAFIHERCVALPGRTCEVGALFQAWCRWCDNNGRREPGTKQTFGRDLRAALPGLRVMQSREGDARYRYYDGIQLR